MERLIEQVKLFNYFGNTISKNGDNEKEIGGKICIAKTASGNMWNLEQRENKYGDPIENSKMFCTVNFNIWLQNMDN